MFVIKRDGQKEEVSFDKVLRRIKGSSEKLVVNPTIIAQKVLSGLKDGIHTQELDELATRTAISLTTTHPDYGVLAARIAVSNHQKTTNPSFSAVVADLATQKHASGEIYSSFNDQFVADVKEHAAEYDALIDHERDFLLDYFGFKTLERSYLLKGSDGRVRERPQHLWMRVAVALWGGNLEKVKETYDALSTKKFIHATPTLFNAGTVRQQCSSCYLIAMAGDSINSIFKTLGDCAAISKHAGGIGLHIHNIRAKGSVIRGTNGTSNGIVPMLRVFNNTARYVDQCFTPDTIIYTENGPKSISTVGVTDKVLTSTGEFRRVKTQIRHDYNGKMLEIQIKNAIYPIRVTNEHQVFALKNQTKGINFNVIVNRLEKNLAAPEFVDAGELTQNDFVVFPIPTYESDIEVITEEDCRFYGILLGDGYISNSVSGVCINNATKVNTMVFVKEYLSNRGINFNEYIENTTVRIKWSSSAIGFKFNKSDLYVNGEKNINNYMMHLPINKAKQIIYGLLETDGCIGDKEITIELSSSSLIESIRYILLRLGILCSGYTRNRVGNVSPYKNITTRLPTAVIRVPRVKMITDMFPSAPKGEYVSYLVHNQYIYSRVQTITEVEYKGVVHDFEIDEPHDYCVAGLGIAHNGGGKRNGSFAIYLEPWHADIEDFLKLKLNQGAEEERARDLFYALWMPDLFMKRVEAGEDWTLFCPSEAPGLADVWGAEFEELYLRYEKEGRGKKKVAAQKLWFKVLEAQIETGTPYLLYKDACNAKSNQQNLGTIKSSNLCVAPETNIYTSDGLFQISSLAGQEVEVWNGTQWSKTVVQKTGEDQPVISVEVLIAKVNDDNKGEYDFELRTIECTPYHKFIVDNTGTQDRHTVKAQSIAENRRVEAKDLKRGMSLVNWMHPDGVPVESIIWSVNDHGRRCDTYCFNEPLTHAGVFNGILTGNCSEIVQYSDSTETSVCNLASISLPAYIKQSGAKREFNFEELRRVTKMITRNLNRVIDINYYPTPETEVSNMRHRPIGIGVQGLADVFAIMRHPWESEKAMELNRRIFANIYYAAVEASAEMAQEDGAYQTFAGSPASHGKLQFDLWDVDPKYADASLDWDGLRDKARRGLRNSLLVAPMPTASTSQILGNTEAFEPTTSNIYTRRTLAGEFIIVNKYLLNDLMRYDVWSEQMKQRIIANNGSVQGIPEIPKSMQELYKTAWELKQKTLIDMAAERGAFICQSQSLNLFVADPTFAKLTSMHFYGWKRGLKTGQYYLRSKAPVVAQKFTVDPELQRAVEESLQKMNQADEGCLMCSG
jgi:ribonucleotide reductase alpha subunit